MKGFSGSYSVGLGEGTLGIADLARFFTASAWRR